MRWLNLVLLVAVLWVNGLAGSGSLSGESIGEIANRYSSFFLPANYTFGIWSLIYLGLAVFGVYQVLPVGADSGAVRRLGWAWIVNGTLNIAWIVAFSFGRFGLALVVMVALLCNLIVITEKVRPRAGPSARGERIFVLYPFMLYLAWISVALIANTFQYITFLGWGGLGIPGEVWTVLMMAVAAGLGVFMAVHRRAWIFPLVVAWALVGIGVRFGDVGLIRWSAYGLAALGVGVLAVRRIWTNEQTVT